MRILQVNTKDMGGGAEKIALALHDAYLQRGHQARFAVGERLSACKDVVQIPKSTEWADFCRRWLGRIERLCQRAKLPGFQKVSGFFDYLMDPIAATNAWLGFENFHYPGTKRLLKIMGARPDIVHGHNLHGGYFDLARLPWLSREVAVVLTLHDAWLLSGHCVHSFECERWVTGCGHCPRLDIYWPIRRDASAFNWRRKKRIYSRCGLNVATPSQWLMDKVQRSILAPGILDCRVIPNGVDVSVFKPGNKQAARARLGIPAEVNVLLFAANGLRQNPWKDYRMLRAAIESVGNAIGSGLLFVGLGGEEGRETLGKAELRFVPYQGDAATVALYYQAADLYIHAARVDTFPNTVLESLACGIPVVATAVGGIPEQIKSLLAGRNSIRAFPADEATGVLTPAGNVDSMVEAIVLLLKDDGLRQQMGMNAQRDAVARFSLDRQVKAYLEWYEEILEREKIIGAGVHPGGVKRGR